MVRCYIYSDISEYGDVKDIGNRNTSLESLVSISILNITYNAHNALEDGKALQQLTVLPVREKQIHFKPNAYIYMLKLI